MIAGNMDAAFLPRPAFKAEGVSIALDRTGDTITIETLDAHLAFIPLITGRLQLHELVLVRPDMRVVTANSSRLPYSFFEAISDRPLESINPNSSDAPLPFNLMVEQIKIDEGAIQLYNSTSNDIWSLTDIEADIAISGRRDIAATGAMNISGVPVHLEAAYTPLDSVNADGINISIRPDGSDVQAKFIGTVQRNPKHDFVGEILVSGSSSLELLDLVGLASSQTKFPAALHEPFMLKTKLKGSSGDIRTEKLIVDFGGTGASGSITWATGTVPSFSVDLEFAAIELSDWKFSATSPANATWPNKFTDLRNISRQAYAADERRKVLDFIQSLTFSVRARAPLLSYEGDVLRDGLVNLSLSNGRLAVNEVGIILPGAMQIRASGLVRDVVNPIFDGALEVDTQHLRSTLAWLGESEALDQISGGRLTKAFLRTTVKGKPTHLSFDDISASIDTVGITGNAFFALGDRASFGVDIAIDSINLDPYVPLLPKKGLRAFFSSKTGISAQKHNVYGVTPILESLRGLEDIDAEMRVSVNAMTTGSISNGRIGLDLGLNNGVLNIRSASFDNLAGATIWFSGGLAGFGATPQFHDFQFDLHTDDLGRFGRVFGFRIPPNMGDLAPFSFTGIVSGGLSQANFVTTTKIGAMTIHGTGQGLLLDQQPQLALTLDASHPSFVEFIQSTGSSWPAGSVDPGPISLSARISHAGDVTSTEDLKLSIGQEFLSGNVTLNKAGNKPSISAKLYDVALAFDRLFPMDPTQQFFSLEKNSLHDSEMSDVESIWSDKPYNWSALIEWNGDVIVSGSRLNMRGIDLSDFNFKIDIAEGIAELSHWDGYVFGAPGDLWIRAAATPKLSLDGKLSFTGGDFTKIATAVNGGGSTGLEPNSGEVDFTGEFNTSGDSLRAFIKSIEGNGTLKLATASVGTGAVAGLLGALSAITQVESIIPAEQSLLAFIDANLKTDKGRIQIVNSAVKSRFYGGEFTGVIDLPNWLVDVSGDLRLEKLPRADATTQRSLPTSVPVTIRGRLDLPDIILDPS